MLHMCLGEGYWVHSLTHLLSVFAPYPSSPIPEMSYTTQPIREARGWREREWKRMGDRETEEERETVRLLVGREEGGHGLPGATYTHLDLSTHPEDAFVWTCAVFMHLRVRVHVRLRLLTFRVAAVLLVGVLVLVERELAWKDEVLSTFFTEWLCGERAWCKQGALNAVTIMLTKQHNNRSWTWGTAAWKQPSIQLFFSGRIIHLNEICNPLTGLITLVFGLDRKLSDDHE